MLIDSLSVPEFRLLSGLNFHAPTKLSVTDDSDGDEGGFSWHIRNEAVITNNVATVIVLLKSAPPTLEGNEDFTRQLLLNPDYSLTGKSAGSHNRKMQLRPSEPQIHVREPLESAIRQQSADLAESAVYQAFKVGLHPIYVPCLVILADAGWHLRQEDVVRALQQLRGPDAVDVLERAAFSIHAHLAYDEDFGLARKCTWALADIGTPEAQRALTRLASCDNAVIAVYARKRLDNWQNELNRKGT